MKDPITGLGIGDALAQSFLLADALAATLGGADWEESLSAYQRQRDAEILPMFQATVTFAQMRDAPPEALAWLRGLMLSPHLCRASMQWLAGALPGILPTELREPLAGMAQVFGARAEAVSILSDSPG